MGTIRTIVDRRNRAPQFAVCTLPSAICSRRRSRCAFTLVELLVVITIIGILAALITAAASGALKKAQQTGIKVEMDQISAALQTFKDTAGSYPPNCQVDDENVTGSEPANAPLAESQILSDLQRQMKQVSGRSAEPDYLIRALAGLAAGDSANTTNLAGGMTAGEAVVFWLSGFSADPKYPISGEGGPSYQIASKGNATNNTLDPIENRRWIYPFEVSRLQPRNTDNFFDGSNNRFIEYTVNINGQTQTRRINFWQYVPAKSEQPFLYFDTSRHPAAIVSSGNVVGPFDPPAATQLSGLGLHVHAIKTRNSVFRPGQDEGNVAPIAFANPEKFQILHAGLDDEWGEESFELMSAHGVVEVSPPRDPKELESYLLYPDGPFTGEVADTIVNFSENTTLEASQP